nr:regulatory protein RecX [Parashewanella tropica]
MHDKLVKKDFELTDIEIALDECEASGYLNDSRYAESLLRSHIYKGHGVIRIRQAMSLKGLSSEVISQAIENSDCDWFELAKEKAMKKYAGKPAAGYNEKAKRIRFLLGQGFDYEQANYALHVSEDD